MATKKFLTVTEAAKRLKLTRSGIHEALRAGRLQAEWTIVTQTHVVKKRVFVISAKSIANFEVDRAQQERGKKN